GVLADEKLFADFASAESRRHRLENLELARCDPKLRDACFVSLERRLNRHFDVNLADHRHLANTRELASEPDAERREHQRDEAAVDLQRVLENEKAVLDELERRDEDAAEQAVYEDGLFHVPRVQRRRSVPPH